VRADVSSAAQRDGKIRPLDARAAANFDGLPPAFRPTGGEASDSPNFEILLDITSRPTHGDKGYEARPTEGGDMLMENRPKAATC
jgi:hypothetical protein